MADARAAPREIDVLVIGAGPAGIAAACEAAAAGAAVALLDDNPAAGGQIWRGGAAAAVSPAARSWFARLAASSARLHAGTSVVDVLPSGDGSRPVEYVTRRGADIERWRPRDAILATGARERFLPFPGWTLPGVVGAGGLQALVKQGLDVRGRRVIVAGSGPLLLAVAELLVGQGAVLVVVAEQAPLWRLARFALGLVTQPAKLAQALGIRRAIGGVLRPGTFPTGVRRADDGLVVSLATGPTAAARTTEARCDILACGFGLVPNVELARAIGCRIEAGRIVVDEAGRTTAAGVWAAGECTGIGGVDAAVLEGRIAGLVAAGRAAAALRLLPGRRRAARFAAALDRTFSLDPRLATLAADDTLVCRCEDVTAGRLRCRGGWREAKLMTRIGMGPCQGRVCGTATEVLFGWGPDDVRPPFTPVTVGAVARPASE